MKAERARLIALALYLVSLLLAILLLFVKQFNQSDYDISGAVSNIIGLYAVPLSIIVTAISARKTPQPIVTPTSVTLLFGSTLLWNFVILGSLAYYDWASLTAVATLMHFNNVEASNFLTNVPAKLTFLVSGALTYFFVGDDPKRVEG